MKKETVLIINSVDIISLTDNDETMIPIKPICEALGVSFQGQSKKIKSDRILSRTANLRLMVGADKKEREMLCLPLRHIYGWLFSINPKNVSPEAEEIITNYKDECYNALYDHFNDARIFLKHKQEVLAKENKELQKISADFASARKRLNDKKASMDRAFKFTIDDWRKNQQQMGNLFSEEFREDFEE